MQAACTACERAAPRPAAGMPMAQQTALAIALTTGSQQHHRYFLLAPISTRSCCNMRQCYRAGQGARRQRSVVGAPQHDHYQCLSNAAPRRAENTGPADAGKARCMQICRGYHYSRGGTGYMRRTLQHWRGTAGAPQRRHSNVDRPCTAARSATTSAPCTASTQI